MKATQAAGVNARIEIDTIRRTITIIPGEPPQDGSKPNENMTNPWDKVLLNAADEKRPA